MFGNTFRKRASAIESFFVSSGVTFTLCAIYVLLNVFLFGFSAVQEYQLHDDFQKYTTTIARGCGAILNLNLAVVLLLASRYFVSFLRETPLSLLVSLDSLMPGLHGVIGLLILCTGIVHTLSHWATYMVKNPWAGGAGGPTYLFVTGVLLIVSIVVVRISALQSVRQNHHEAFRRGHLVGSVACFIFLCMHGLHRGTPSSWKWVIFPIALFAADAGHSMMKEKRSYLLISKHSALFQGQSVLKLRLPPVFHYKPGQYAEIKVPCISKSQWHPFTIASAPHEAELVFYVKAAGDWTTALFQLFAERFRDESSEDIQIHVRGPFGAPAQHVDHFDHLVLIGGGVGATPFCSIVKTLDNYMTQWQQNRSRNNRNTNRRRRTSSSGGSLSSESISSGPQNIHSDTTMSSYVTAHQMPDLSGESFWSQKLSNLPTAAVKIPASRSLEIRSPSRSEFKNSNVHAASIRDDIEGFRQRTANPNPALQSEWQEVARPVSHASKASYWQAVNSLYGDASIQATCKESFDILLGMSFGTPTLVSQLQRRRKEGQMPSIGAGFSVENGDIDLGVFTDKTFLFLVYMKSVTANLALLWALLCRGVIAGAAAMFGAVSVQRNGFAIYSSPLLLSIDLGLTALIAVGVAIPAFVEVYKLGPTTFAFWFDIFLLTPCTFFSVLANILAFAGVASSLEYAGSLSLFVIWPLTAALFLLRLIHVVGERVSMGETRLRPVVKGARSVEFHWTTPTREDDSWLVDELCNQHREKVTKLYRYITRQKAPEDAGAPENSGIEKTEYRRPDWVEIMNDVAERSKNGSRVGVFLCGPESMAKQVQDALQSAMRNSIVRGLQGNAHVVRSLEEVFGSDLTANEHTGDTLEAGGPEQNIGCNIRMVFHKERFS